MNILLFTLFYPFVITIIHDFSRNHKPLKSTDNEEYDNYLKELLFNKTNTSPQVIKYDEKNLKNLILLQLESFPYELVNNRISPNFYNLSQKYEFLAPIKVQPYCSWTTGAVVATQCGIPQILPDSNWEFRRQGKFLYNKNIVCLSDILGSFGYKKIFALTGTESVMGFGEFRKSKNFEKIAQMKNDLKLSCFIAENFLPMMDDDIRGKAHVDIPQKKSRRRRRRRRKVIKNENPVTDNNNKNKTRYLVYIRPEDTHTPYLRPKWCFLNNTHFDSYEKCFNCVDYAINIIIQKYLELKMYEHTLLVVYPDHTPFGASFIKENNHLFILFPGMEKVSDEKKINRSITYYDFAPTILDMIGIKDYLPSYPFGSNIYNINNSETLKHTKPDENDLDVIDNFLNFQPKLINIINSTRMYKCYKRYHQYDTFYYSNKPCNYTSELKDFIDSHQSKIYLKDKNQKTDQLSVIKCCECDLSEKLSPNFFEERKIGQNNDYLCQLIRNDSVVEFISYTNKKNLSYENQINHSIYETNQFLLKNKKTTFIEYAAFFGSIQIFQYLQNNGVKLTPSIWLYAIHGNNASIIRLLEENHVEPTDKTYKQCLKESIKLHHNDIALYIIENYIQSDSMNNQDICIDGLKYYNFAMIPKDANIDHSLFGCLCKYDYYEIVNILLKKGDFDVNMYYENIYNGKNFNNIQISIDSIKFYLIKFQQHLTF